MENIDALKSRPIGKIDDKDAQEITHFLNDLLANEFGLFTKTLNYHWNVTGPRFHSMHKFLEGQYHALLGVMDDVAERVRIIGDTPISTVSKMKESMSIKEENGKAMSTNDMLKDLLETNLAIQTDIKSFVNHEELFKSDPGTEDFLVGLLQKHEETSWMIKSHLV